MACNTSRSSYAPGTSPRAQRLPKPDTPCSLPGCDRHVYARGLCKMHYEQQRLMRGNAGG